MYKLEDYTHITNTLEMVTPETAKAWLLLNREENRNIKRTEIHGVATDICNGNWTIDNNSICFDTYGRLCDGQNRLHAIIEAGIAVPTFVRRGLVPKAMQTIDGGIGRTLRDRMIISGTAGTDPISQNALQAIVKAVYVLLGGTSEVRMTVMETKNTYDRFQNIFETVYHICYCGSKGNSFAVRNRFTAMAIIAAMCNGVSERRCRAFVDCISKGEISDAVALGCNYNAAVQYLNSYAHKVSGKWASIERYSIANRAIYCFVTGKKKTTISTPYPVNETNLTWLEGRLEKRKEEIND